MLSLCMLGDAAVAVPESKCAEVARVLLQSGAAVDTNGDGEYIGGTNVSPASTFTVLIQLFHHGLLSSLSAF